MVSCGIVVVEILGKVLHLDSDFEVIAPVVDLEEEKISSQEILRQ